MTALITFIIAFALTSFGVVAYRGWSVQRGIIDHPNERSSHDTPTPRGSGIVIFIVCIAAYLAGSLTLEYSPSLGFVSGAFLLAAISWLDDVYTVPVYFRLPVQAAAVILAIADLGYVERVELPFVGVLELGIFGAVITFGWVIWMLNAYNFMDGIDGIAGIQAAVAGVGWMVIGSMTGSNGVFIFGGTLACSAAGFLVHNWEPATVFMGDVGSSFLGYAFALMPLLAIRDVPGASAFLPAAAVFLLWFFVFDSVWTFFRRVAARQKVWLPHREHIYQHLVIARVRHSTVSFIYGILAGAAAVLTVWRADVGGNADLFVVLFMIAAPIGLLIGANRMRRIDPNDR